MKKVWNLVMKQFGFTVLAAVLLVCATSCGDDEDKATIEIKITVENGASYNAVVDEIKAVVSNHEVENIVASGKYANGEFTVMLPETIPSEYLYTPEYSTLGITVSPPTVKIGELVFGGFKNGEPVPYWLYCYKETADLTVYAEYFYANSDATIKGTYSAVTWNISLKKGWNKIYTYVEDSGNKVTYNNQDPGNLKWKFEGQ
ncbi:MAG: hypothetical protein LBN37_01595 [Bacteroidales bacterium]|jgi:hypothetical protein|nr:hypothetical protein [Bacteroidales bacterium]